MEGCGVSEPEQQAFEPPDARSSVKIIVAAKGEIRWEVKVRVGDTEAELVAAYKLAVKAHHALQAELVTEVGATT